MSSGKIQVTLIINGEEHETKVWSTESLADTLRERLGMTGTKIMCNQGECGSCTVLIDKIPVSSCLTLTAECERKEITTIEGLIDPESDEMHPIQQAFVDNNGMQCGICTPGMIVASKALLDEKPYPTEDEIREAIAGNLCRCGNYKRITECVMNAAGTMQGGA